MPYYITEAQPDCGGWATVKEQPSGSLTTIGCHESKQDAIDQMVALSIAEDMEPGGERNLDGPPAIIVDIDSTIVDEDGAPIENVIRFLDEYEGEVIIVTARLERRRDETVGELERLNVDWDQLFMRASNDVSALDYKSETMKDLLDVYNIELAIDDDDEVRAEYARIGVTALTPDAVDPIELPEMVGEREARPVDLDLPAYIRDAAARGLELRSEGYGGDGLVDRTIREARLMADGQISEDKVVRVAAWAARHMVDLESPANSDADADDWPGNGAIAFYLWGIDPLDPGPAIAWFERKRDEIQAEEEEDAQRFVVRDRPDATMFRMENGVETRRINVNDFEIREAADGAGMTFSGYAAVFNSPSEPLPFTERIAPGAFTRSLRSRNEIKLFVNHDSSRVLASKRAGTMRLSEDAYGLRVEADLPDTTDGRDMAVLIRRGDIDSMSFGFTIPQGGDSWSDDGQQRELREIRLHECSIVTGFPAYTSTTASVRSLDGLVDATGIEADKLNAAITALEKGETLDDELAGVLDAAVSKLRTERDDVIAKLAMKQKQIDTLLARV
jgi:HK97 family phage prohead protease